MKKYPNQILLLEGFYYNYDDFNIHENAIRGMLLSVALDFKIPIIYTENEEDTANFLILTAKKYGKPTPKLGTRPTKTLKTPEEERQFILEGFPGVGPVAAQSLMENFKNLKGIFNANKKQLEKILTFDEKKIDKFLELLRN